MRTLEATPIKRFSWDFRVVADGGEETTLELKRFRDRGRFVLEGVEHTLAREGFLFGPYRLDRVGVTLARAVKRGLFRTTYEVSAGDRVLTLRQRGLLGLSFDVEHGGRPVGTIAQADLLKRTATARLDVDLTLPRLVFVVFLALVEWRHHSRRSA